MGKKVSNGLEWTDSHKKRMWMNIWLDEGGALPCNHAFGAEGKLKDSDTLKSLAQNIQLQEFYLCETVAYLDGLTWLSKDETG